MGNQMNRSNSLPLTGLCKYLVSFFFHKHRHTQSHRHVSTYTHTLYCMCSIILCRCAHTLVRPGCSLNVKVKKTVASLISIYTNSPLISLTKAPTALFSRLPPFESQCSGLSMAASLIKAAARRRGRPRL